MSAKKKKADPPPRARRSFETVSEKIKERVIQAGFVFLLAFMGLIIVQDMIKIF